jgi:hypothetical protein
MTGVEIAATVCVVAWVGFLACIVGLLHTVLRSGAAGTREDVAADALTLTHGFERLRTAIAAAGHETDPGQPSADLIDCWGIWPDATPYVGEDGTS